MNASLTLLRGPGEQETQQKKKGSFMRSHRSRIQLSDYKGNIYCCFFLSSSIPPAPFCSPAVFLQLPNIILQSGFILTPIITPPLLFGSLLLNKDAVKIELVFILTMAEGVSS